MPTFDESFPAIVAALAEGYGRDLGPSDPDSFASLIAVLLGRSLDQRKCLRALDSLRDAGLLEPRALAEAESVEVGEAFRT
ncbi:endonuclease III domain-containing protein, partial [Singulisphaera rosea]